jgi:hypothetical protein
VVKKHRDLRHGKCSILSEYVKIDFSFFVFNS